jgi:CRISPR-associated protein Cas2
MTKRLYMVAYDIGEPRRWRKVFKLMHGYGERVQLSVFRCRLTDGRRARLERDLARVIEPGIDRVLIADLGPLPRAMAALAAFGTELPATNDGPWIA